MAKAPNRLEIAETFLAKLLWHGPLSARAVLSRARRKGISVQTLYLARRALGVRSFREGRKAFWTF